MQSFKVTCNIWRHSYREYTVRGVKEHNDFANNLQNVSRVKSRCCHLIKRLWWVCSHYSRKLHTLDLTGWNIWQALPFMNAEDRMTIADVIFVKSLAHERISFCQLLKGNQCLALKHAHLLSILHCKAFCFLWFTRFFLRKMLGTRYGSVGTRFLWF